MIRHKNKKKPKPKRTKDVTEEVFNVVESSLEAFLSIFNSGKSDKKKYYRVYKD
jgi:hypothetical protein